MIIKSSANGSIPVTPASIREKTANNSVELDDIKECQKGIPHWDPLGDFISQCCVMSGEVSRKDIYLAYVDWAKINQHVIFGKIAGVKLFAILIRGYGVGENMAGSGLRWWTGISLKKHQDTDISTAATPLLDPPFVRYGCLGCTVSQPAGHCLFGNDVGDEYCLRDRKLNTRATEECVRKGCISAIYVEGHTLVCTHNESKCVCIDRLGNTYGDLQRTRQLREILDSDKHKEILRLTAIKGLQSRPRIEEVMIGS